MIHREDLETCIAVLEAIARDRGLLSEVPEPTRVALQQAAGRVARPDVRSRRRLAKAHRRRDAGELRRRDEQLLAETGIRSARRESVFTAPPRIEAPAVVGRLEKARSCYICKEDYHELHAFYDALCPTCGSLNYQKRHQTANLTGQVALVTGARIKIGYQTALMLLRAGARVLVTTRFPHDAARRYSREADFASWGDRLEIHGLDLRHAPTAEVFATGLVGRLPRLDVLINNAAQTVRRPPGFYNHLLADENRPLAELPAETRPLVAAHHAQGRATGSALVPWHEAWDAAAFPDGRLDADLQQVDLRPVNSWRLPADQVPTVELLEVHLVNAVAPFILTSRLRPLMVRGRTDARHVIQVSAMEAQFSRKKKTDKHPHTNMAKSALNMLTRTSAVDYAADGIFMNSVDTGWITDEDPFIHVERKQRVHGFHPPLDIVDGAARILDPLFSGLNSGSHPWGLFFKDYRPVDW